MASPARVAAYEILRAVNCGRSDLPAAIARSRRRLADDRDRALAAEIAAGTLRWLAEVDHVVAAFAKKPLDRLDPEVLDILRLTLYQMLHLDRVPVSAAVDDAVDLCRKSGKRSATGFVNAVLRSVSRARALPLPARPSEDDEVRALDYLSVTLSHPRWFAARRLRQLGLDAAERWVRFDNQPAPLTIRANTLRVTRAQLTDTLAAENVAVEAARFAPDALVVADGNPLRSSLAADGAFHVQDEASQLVGLFTMVQPGERVLDACASPGGKTLEMAAMMHGRGVLVASDFRPRRVALLASTLRGARARGIRIVQADLRRPLPFAAVFDCVLVDAPCSGLGTIRRDPEIRWRRQESELAGLAANQVEMLQQAADVVRPGGRIVYSTCSSEAEENEDVVRRFLERRQQFVLEDPRSAGDVAAGVAAVLDDEGCLRTLPHVHGLEAFFAARLRRT
jgi:16S rRNA (cytosine967-C5)-methyltransferase